MTSCVFTVPFFLVWSTVNSFAWYYGSTQALPATTIILLMLIWLIIGFPLTVLGGIIGKNTAGTRKKILPNTIRRRGNCFYVNCHICYTE